MRANKVNCSLKPAIGFKLVKFGKGKMALQIFLWGIYWQIECDSK